MATVERRTSDPEIFPRCREALFVYERESNTQPVQLTGARPANNLIGIASLMYFHGLDDVGTQVTRVATSRNGIDSTAQSEVLGRSYMRAFKHDGMTYVLAMPRVALSLEGWFTRVRTGSEFA